MMRPLLSMISVLALAPGCSKSEEASPGGREERLCTAAEAGPVTAAKAAELLDAVRQSDKAGQGAACARFAEVIKDGRKADIPDRPDCRWDDRNSTGNPHFLISLHLTQLKGKARATCRNMQ